MDNKYDVFISYSSHDTNVVNEFVERLEREGFSVCDGIESGDAFKRIILQAIKNSAVVLFFSSQFSNQSSWTAKEIGVAVKYKKPVIPILLDGSNYNEEVEFDLINLDYIDYQDVTERGNMIDRLVKSLKAKIPNPIGQRKAEEPREAAGRGRRALQSTPVFPTSHSDIPSAGHPHRGHDPRSSAPNDTFTPKSKSKKGLWIAFAAAAAVVLAVVLILAWPPKADLSSSGSYNGHEYVDLGLPSGTLWATCNVGSSKPEDYGDYYAWGETQTKNIYDWDTYKYTTGKWVLTKYCCNSVYVDNGFIDNLTTLLSEDDAATTNWGNGWCMPTKEQWDELLQNTSNKWKRQNGVKGILFTARNGKSIFLPAAGCRRFDSSSGNTYAGIQGFYWSRSLNTDNPVCAWFLFFHSDYSRMEDLGRGSGSRVRPVRKK